ncbi:hypothetical protein CPF11_11455 [Acetobacter pomorum]|nr:hypothetical protein CPF11_11455 [Acetobacter pomorum]
MKKRTKHAQESIMSLYLRNLLAHRQAEREAVTAASMQAAFQQKPPSQARIEALRRWNQKRQAEAKKATQAAEKKCRDAYWPWFCSLPEADRHRAWTLAELVPIFGVNRQTLARHLRLMGWQCVHCHAGNVWKAPKNI